MSRKKKVRVELRKNQQKGGRSALTSKQLGQSEQTDNLPFDERMSGKGASTRRRTVNASDAEVPPAEIANGEWLAGRVLIPRGATSLVATDNGERYECAVRRLLRSIATDERGTIVAGDRVWIRPGSDKQGFIERVEPRRGTLSRKIRNKKQVIAANIDIALIVASASDPPLKPGLIDRYLISAAIGGIQPIICINKADLVDLAELQPIIGIYSQLGYEVIVTSTKLGWGVDRLRERLKGRETVFSGQSGVGKSSLINAIEPGLNIRTIEVSEETGKGKHTTTSASLVELSFGGWVVDTPGIRQMELSDVAPDEIAEFFIEFRAVSRACRFHGCSHTHESGCAVKQAVRARQISILRYESYWKLHVGDG